MEPADAELVGRAKKGDRLAFDELMGRYEREIIAVAYRMLGNNEDAVDCAQETFFRAYRGLPQFRQEASFRTWLYQIALNLARHRRRWYARHRISQTVSLDEPIGEEESDLVGEQIPDAGPTPRDESARVELRKTLLDALSGLPDSMKTIVVLRDMNELPYEEIAHICGESLGTVKSRLHRARGMLREKLKSVEP